MKRLILRVGAVGALILALFGGPVLADGHTVTQGEIDAAQVCPSDMRGDEPVICACNAGMDAGSVWGSGPYTGDSAVCAAAAHAGALEAGVGVVVLLPMGPQDGFAASERNGVSTSKWGGYGSSYAVFAAQLEIAGLPGDVDRCPATMPTGADSLTCACDSDVVSRSVWGTGTYTADSDICSAATHAGALANGPVIVVTATDGQDSYTGSEANGVTTRDWRAYGRSVIVASLMDTGTVTALESCSRLPSGVDRYSCSCGADDGTRGSIYGSGPYTADSDICTAARHDGALTREAANVTVLRIGGLDTYGASERNGIMPTAWGRYSGSIVFDRNN